MAENYSFFNSKNKDRVYNAKHWADYFFPLFKSGVFNGDLQVVSTGGMKIKIKMGYAWINGYAYHLTRDMELDLETASGNMNRADSIVLRLDLTNRWIKSFVKTGNYYANTPIPPEPERTSTVYELVIAHVFVSSGTTMITQDMIEDVRMDNIRCGWVCGTVEEVDFTQIKAQFDAFFEKYEADIVTEYGLYLQSIGSLLEQAQANYNEWIKNGNDNYNDLINEMRSFYETLSDQGQAIHDQYSADIARYFTELQETGNNNLLEITRQFMLFRNEKEAEFLEWFEHIKGILGEEPAGSLQIKTDRLAAQVEDLETMLLDGTVRGKLNTDQGNYITDSMGNALLIGWPICNCNKQALNA